MGKLGDWSYPYIRVSRAFDIANRICGSPYNGQISVSGLAQELHLKEGTGGFGNLVKSLKDYGLVEGRGTLRATDLAKRIAVGTAEEVSASQEESFLKIPLFREIYKRIGIQVPDKERFSTLLGEITKADRLEITKRTPTIRNLYLDGCRYLKPEKKEEGEELQTMEKKEGAEFDIEKAIPTEAFGRFTLKGVGYVDITDMDTYGIAEAYMKVLAKKLKAKSEEEG